jgi:hypothetical protein
MGVRVTRRTLSSGWIALAVAASLGVFGPLLLAEHPIRSVTSSPASLAFALCLVSAWRLGSLIGRARLDPLAFTFWLFVYIWLALAPFIQLDADRFAYRQNFLGTTFPGSVRSTGMIIIIAGVIAYESGRALGRSMRRTPREPRWRLLITPASVRSVCVATALVAAAGVLAIGPDLLFSSRKAFNTAAGVGDLGGSLTGIVTRIPIAVAGYLAVSLLSAARAGAVTMRRSTRLQLGFAVIACFVVNNPLTTARFLTGSLLVGMGLAVVMHSRTSHRRILMAALVGGVFILFPLGNQFRGKENQADASLRLRDNLIETSDFSMYSQVMTGVEFASHSGTPGIFLFTSRGCTSDGTSKEHSQRSQVAIVRVSIIRADYHGARKCDGGATHGGASSRTRSSSIDARRIHVTSPPARSSVTRNAPQPRHVARCNPKNVAPSIMSC